MVRCASLLGGACDIYLHVPFRFCTDCSNDCTAQGPRVFHGHVELEKKIPSGGVHTHNNNNNNNTNLDSVAPSTF